MKNILLSAVMIIGLSACASTQQGFGPAYGSDFGYRNTKLQQDRFRISYTSRDLYESRDFALLRAAQIADIEGYSHFKICLLYTSPSPRDQRGSRMPSSA